MVRTFCMNPHGVVVNENTNGIVTVNGHSYEDPAKHTENTNFALLVSKHFSEPFKDSNGYGESIAGERPGKITDGSGGKGIRAFGGSCRDSQGKNQTQGNENGKKLFHDGSFRIVKSAGREIGICPQGGRPSRGRQCRQPSRDERDVLSFCLWVPLGIAAWFDKLEFGGPSKNEM